MKIIFIVNAILMQTYIVEHPLRTIHFELQDKAQTSLEASAIPAYINLHNDLWKVKQLGEQYGKGIQELQSMLKNIQAAYTAMETETKKYGRAAGFTDEDASQFLPELEEGKTEYTLKVRHLEDLIAAYSVLADRYNERSRELDKFYKTADATRERFNESFSYFHDNYFSPIIKAYDDVQIDTPSFDIDCDQFREVCGEVDDLYDRLIDEWNAMGEKIEETTRNVRQLDEHFKCLSYTINAAHLKKDNPGLN